MKDDDKHGALAKHAALRNARDELREAAELLKALAAVDLSKDLTKPAYSRARESLARAATAYAAAHDAHFGGGTPDERRKAARAQAAA